jgi:plasmid maintenance system antidote protein VapI
MELPVQSVNIMSKDRTGPAKGGPVSTALRNAIRDEGLTAYAAAKRAGVSVDAVQRFLNQRRGLTLATVDKLAAAMRLTLCPDDSPA